MGGATVGPIWLRRKPQRPPAEVTIPYTADLPDQPKDLLGRRYADPLTGKQQSLMDVSKVSEGEREARYPGIRSGESVDAYEKRMGTKDTPGMFGGGARPASGGAASATDPMLRTVDPRPSMQPGDFDFSRTSDAAPWGSVTFADKNEQVRLGWTRFSTVALVGNSPVSEHRFAANALMTDVLGKRGRHPGTLEASTPSAMEFVESRTRARLFDVESKVKDLHAKWKADAKARGEAVPMFSYRHFDQLVTKAQRRLGTFGQESNPHVAEAASLRAKSFYDEWLFASRHRVPGVLPDKPISMDYVPRIGHRHNIDRAIAANGFRRVHTAVRTAIFNTLQPREGVPLILERPRLEKLADRMAAAWLRNAGTHREIRHLPGIGLDEFAERVREVLPEMDEVDIDTLRKALVRTNTQGAPSRAMHRTPMDELHVHQFDDGTTLAIEDLLVNDGRVLHHAYVRQMVGASAIAEFSRVHQARYAGNGFATLEQFDSTMRTAAMREGVENASDMAKLNIAYRLVAGIPVQDEDTALKAVWFSAIRSVLGFSFMRHMSAIRQGIANAEDMVRAIGSPEAGFRAVVQQFPALKDIVSKVLSGKPPPPGIVAAVTRLGLGTGRITGNPAFRDPQEGVLGAVTRVENASRYGARGSAYISAAAPVQDVGEVIAGAAAMQRWLNMAKAGETLSDSRLAALGIDEALARRINDQMVKHARATDTGLLVDPAESLWDDQEAATAFRMAIQRFVRRATNTTDSSAHAAWMHTHEGRLLSQFKSYSFRAHESQLLFGLQQRDAGAFANWAVSSAVATLSHTVWVYMSSLGREDRDEYLRANLSPEALGRAALSRAAWTGLLPTVTDATFAAMGAPAPFHFTQRSGQYEDGRALSVLFDAPALAWARSAVDLPAGLRAPLDENYDLSRRDIRNLENALFLPKGVGIVRGLRAVTQSLPPTSVNAE